MEGVVGGAVAGHLGIDVRITGTRVLQFLQDHDGAGLRDHEAGAIPIEGARGALGMRIVGGQSFHVHEAGQRDRQDHRIGAARDHGVGVAALDDVHGLAQGVAPGGAGRDGRHVGAGRAGQDGDMAGRGVTEEVGQEERVHAVGTARLQRLLCLQDRLEAARG